MYIIQAIVDAFDFTRLASNQVKLKHAVLSCRGGHARSIAQLFRFPSLVYVRCVQYRLLPHKTGDCARNKPDMLTKIRTVTQLNGNYHSLRVPFTQPSTNLSNLFCYNLATRAET